LIALLRRLDGATASDETERDDCLGRKHMPRQLSIWLLLLDPSITQSAVVRQRLADAKSGSTRDRWLGLHEAERPRLGEPCQSIAAAAIAVSRQPLFPVHPFLTKLMR
jgi:hypothetical protein